jgi:hypothetical protein
MTAIYQQPGVNQYCWLLEYPLQFVVCRHVKCRSVGLRLVEPPVRGAYGSERVLEKWSVGLKSGNRSDF